MIILKRFQLSDITKEYISWINDKSLFQFSKHRKKYYTKDSAIKFYKELKKNKDYFFVIIKKEKNLYIKIGTLIGRINKKKDCDLSILIIKQKKGYGLAAFKKAIKFFFKKNIKAITGGTLANNIGMLKIFKKSGMKLKYKKFKKFEHFDNKKLIVHYYIKNPKTT